MKKIWKASEWKCGSQWYVNNVDDLCGKSGEWWIPACILYVSFENFIKILIKDFSVTKIRFRNNVLIYSWSNYESAHKWLLYINKIAKDKNITI